MNKGYGKKLTKAQRMEFSKYTHAAKWAKPLMNYYLREVDGVGIYLTEECKLWAYILLFIPLHLLQALHCIWDGGLINFEIASRKVGSDYLSYGSTRWELANKILGVDK